MANARFEERFGDRSAALKQYRRAADTHTEAGYLALVDFDIRSHDMDGAYATVQQAKADLPQSRVIADRALEVKALSLTQKNPQNLRPLIEVLSQDPSRAAETETLRTLAAAHDGVISQAELLPELRAVADRYPTYLPLQEQLINAYLKLNRGDDAVLIARRLMDALPTDPSVARLATNALQATGRWNEARLAAEQWRARAGGDTLDPDTAIAQIKKRYPKMPAFALPFLKGHFTKEHMLAGPIGLMASRAAVKSVLLTHFGGDDGSQAQMDRLTAKVAESYKGPVRFGKDLERY